MRPGMMIELDRCVGCRACVTACKERWDSGPGAARAWVHEFERGTRAGGLELTFYPGLCMQCSAHPCTAECPTGATYADEQGIVVVDRDLCIGCGNCIPCCPYGARHADPTLGVVEKCNLCAPYVARGGTPACVSTCLAECRHYGDLDEPGGELMRRITERGAQPLTTAEVNVGPRIHYAPVAGREHVLANGVVRAPESGWVTGVWQGATRPAAQVGVPMLAFAALLGGALVDFRARGAREKPASAAPTAFLPRHRLGMRLLHWFNASSWLVLLVTGTALMASPAFALFGTELPRLVAAAVGGAANLLWLHVLWGLAWALVIVPGFLAQKRGGWEALRETRLTADDLRWLVQKPLAMLGLRAGRLPPQDKYNAGQKLFALSVLTATAVIIASGAVMTFHVGGAGLVSASLIAHKLGILTVLAGLGVHLTMALVLRDERPALRAMVRGDIDREHAAKHASKWVDELEPRARSASHPRAEETER